MIINRSFSSSLSNKEHFGSLKGLVLLVVIAILATSNTYAQASFETIGGLSYLIYPDAKTAALTFNPSGEKYSGNIVVPEKVKANDGVEYPVTAFADNAFKECVGLQSITIPSSVTSLGNSCFYKCYGLTNITIPTSVTSLGESCFRDCYGLTSITIPSSVTSLGECCFYECSGLTSITIPSSVTSLSYDCFAYCSGLTSITIPSSVTSLSDGCFGSCSGLTSITIPSSVTSLGSSCFAGCTGLASITIPSSVTSLGSWCFSDCSNLTSITIPSSVTSLGEGCFSACSGLTNITIPSSVTSLGKSCFYECYGLTNITIPSSVTSLGESCFSCCTGLTSITLPSSVSSLGYSCFERCFGLTSITLPSSITYLGSMCFSCCSGLTSITIPSSVTSLGGWCFEGCSELKKVTFQGKLPNNTINCSLQSTCIIYVLKAYLQDYKDVLGSKYSYIYASKDEESGDQNPNKQCAVPTISYADGKLTFACSTPNAEYHYTITDTDMASDAYSKDGIVKLSAAYNISAYATADGYKPSDKATATLYWVEANLQNNPTNINQTATRGIIVTSNDGIVTLSGLNNDETVRFYTVDGKQLGAAKAVNGAASQAVSESIVIAKMGNQTIKIAVK